MMAITARPNLFTAAAFTSLINAAVAWFADSMMQFLTSLVRPLALVRCFASLMLISTLVLVNESHFTASLTGVHQWGMRSVIVLPSLLLLPCIPRPWKVKVKLQELYEKLCGKPRLKFLDKPLLKTILFDAVNGLGTIGCYWGSNALGSFLNVLNDAWLIHASITFVFFLLTLDLLFDFEEAIKVVDSFIFGFYGLLLKNEKPIVPKYLVSLTCGVLCIVKSYLRSNMTRLHSKLEGIENQEPQNDPDRLENVVIQEATTANPFTAAAFNADSKMQFLSSLVRPLALVRWLTLLMLISTLVLVNASDFTASLTGVQQWGMRSVIVLPAAILLVPYVPRPWNVQDKLEKWWGFVCENPWLKSILFDVVKGLGAMGCYWGSNALGSFVKVFSDSWLVNGSMTFIFVLLSLDFLYNFEEAVEIVDNFVMGGYGLMLNNGQTVVPKYVASIICSIICVLKSFLRSNMNLLLSKLDGIENQEHEDEEASSSSGREKNLGVLEEEDKNMEL